MKLSPKLGVDLLFTLAIPVIILNYFSAQLGNVLAYTMSALIPAAYVLIDTYRSRQFNAISTYIAAGAILRAVLTFWFVDGLLFAFKDSAGYFLPVVILGGSLLIKRPFFGAFMYQLLSPENERQKEQAKALLARPASQRGMRIATLIVAVQSLIAGIINIFVNYSIVVAPFDTAEFNSQVAQANLLMGPVGSITSILALGYAFYLSYKYIFRSFPGQRPMSLEDMQPEILFKLMDEEEMHRSSASA